MPRIGDFELGDKIKKIYYPSFDKINKKIIFMVEWKTKKYGFKPIDCELSSIEIKKYDPYILLEYYEDRLNWDYLIPKNSFNLADSLLVMILY